MLGEECIAMQQAQELFDYFYSLKKHSSLGTSYAFVGEDSSIVFEIIKLITCQDQGNFCSTCWDCKAIERRAHPDLLIVEPEGLAIKIEAIREAIRFLSLKSFHRGPKAVIIKEAQNLTQEAQAAFLKTLEEPPENSFIALCTSKLEALLPTTNSRCRKIFLPFIEKPPALKAPGVLEVLSGREVIFKDRQEFSSFLWSLISLLHQGLLAKESGQNNQLSNLEGCAIILENKSSLEIQ